MNLFKYQKMSLYERNEAKYYFKKRLVNSQTSYIMVLPFMLIFLTFVVIPVIISVFYSFTYYNVIEPPKFIGWENYKQLFIEDKVFLIAVKNTIVFSAVTGPISYIACLLFAWMINDLTPKIRAVATLLFYAPSISGNVYLIWKVMFSGDTYGYINGLLMNIGIINEPILWLSTPSLNLKIIMIVQLWMSLGTGFLTFIAGLKNIDESQLEAAAVDGMKNRWQELFYIIIPNMKPQLIFGAVLQISATFAVSDICMNLAGFPSPLYSAHTIVLHMIDYGTLRYEMGYASAIAVVLFTLTLVTNHIMRKMIKISD